MRPHGSTSPCRSGLQLAWIRAFGGLADKSPMDAMFERLHRFIFLDYLRAGRELMGGRIILFFRIVNMTGKVYARAGNRADRELGS